jgi:hypothetical protein
LCLGAVLAAAMLAVALTRNRNTHINDTPGYDEVMVLSSCFPGICDGAWHLVKVSVIHHSTASTVASGNPSTITVAVYICRLDYC